MSTPEYDPHSDVEPGPEARNMEIAEHLLSTAFQLRAAGSFEEAEPLFLQALNVHERVLGSNHPDTIKSLVSVAVAYRKASRYCDAARLLDQALAASARVYGPSSCDHANILELRAWVSALQGRYLEGEAIYKHVMEIIEDECEPDSYSLAETLYQFA